MEYRNLGRTGLKVSEVCLGAMHFGGPTDEQTSVRILDEFADAGGTFIDTADVYNAGESEAVVGRWLKGRDRDAFVVATKVYGAMGAGPNDDGLSRKHILAAVEASLRRLGTDYIDLYYTHVWDTATPLEETLATLDTLVHPARSGLHGITPRPSRALREAIRSGRVSTGTVLPPSRELAAQLDCSRWAVTQAYSQLVTEGYLATRVGSGTWVSWSGPTQRTSRRTAAASVATYRFDLAPGAPDLRAFPRTRWAEAARAAARTVPTADLGYPDEQGYLPLRELMADYLQRSRGAIASAADVAIRSGVSASVAQLCAGLRAMGIDRIAVEDPGWTRLRTVIESTGMRLEPVPVDHHGLQVERLSRRDDLRAVVVTAAHQFPTGVVLAPHRRLGSVSKTLSPAIGIGWFVAQGRWRSLLEGRSVAGPSTIDQATFAELVAAGAYDRHLRAMQRRYKRRRDCVLTALHHELPTWTIGGPLLDYRIHTDETQDGIVLGYGNIPDNDVPPAIRSLAKAVANSRPRAAPARA